MLNHMGFSCWISSGGVPLPTYSEESLGSARSAWIASEAGKPFTVHWQDKSGKRIATSGHVFIDGKDVASAIMRPGRDAPVKRSGAKTRRNLIKPFAFSELSLTDDDTLASPYDTSLRSVGTIRVEITRVRLGAEVPFAGYDDEAKNHGLVHERAKKAGAHCIKFGEAKRVENGRTVSVSTAPYDPNEPGPYVIFEFRYRSLEMLKATGIVPNNRKRPNMDHDDDEVIEIYSSDDEAASPTLHPSSPRTSSRDAPSKKRVKVEPIDDKLPASSPPPSSNDEPKETQDNIVLPSTQMQPDTTQSSERLSSLSPTEPNIDTKDIAKAEDDGDEELDMLHGESEGTLSTEPSQNIDYLGENLLPPPSSSLVSEPLVNDDDEADA